MSFAATSRTVLAVWAAALAGCSGGKPEYAGPPILVIGVDGLEWSVLEPLVEAGRAPHFAALLERGVGGELQTDMPTYSPVVWTSIATGVKPAQHGVRFFLEVGARGMPREDGLPYTSNSRRTPAVWNIADDHGREVLSVAWWVSWPAERLRHGRVVASYAAQAQGKLLWKPGVWEQGLPELTWPPELQQELRPALDAGRPDGPLREEFDGQFGTVPREWNHEAQLDALFRFVYHADRTHLEITKGQLAAGAADLNLVYFGLPDVAGHFFWRYHEPEAFTFTTEPGRLAALRGRVERSYEQVDAWLGELLAAAPPETRVVVLSDHGMHANPAAGPFDPQSGNHQDAPPGVLVVAGPDVPARGLLPEGRRRLGSVYQVAPTLLHWLGLGVPSDFAAGPMPDLLSPEWAAAHPVTAAPACAEGFREATPPRVPVENADALFNESLMEQLGYAEASGRPGEQPQQQPDGR